jgi:hypothetical protein
VQFYQDDTFLKELVTSFLTEGLQVNSKTVPIVVEGEFRDIAIASLDSMVLQ